MKKVQLLFLLMFVGTFSFGQMLSSGKKVNELTAKYIEVRIKAKKAISVNYGQKGGRDDVVTKDREKFYFNNDIHIINFFYKNGYDFLYQDTEMGTIRFILFEE